MRVAGIVGRSPHDGDLDLLAAGRGVVERDAQAPHSSPESPYLVQRIRRPAARVAPNGREVVERA